MCTRLKMRVKSLSPSGIKNAFLPCGKCYECRTFERDCWTSRLRGEILAVTPGTYTAFCTLTYSDEKIPHIPLSLIKDEYLEYYRTHGTPMCFSKEHVSGFVKSLRDWFRYFWGYHRPIYMVCCEYGEHTQRSHMHMILNFPMQIDPRQVFNKIHELWEPYGHVFPRYFEGGEDGRHYKHKPFLCDSVNAACSYAAKYCTKDLKYYEQINLKHFKHVGGLEGEIKLSRYLPFHVQTRQLGLRCIEKLDTLSKLDILEHGLSFVGDTHLHRLPKYFKNKLLFHNYYRKLEDGRRQVRLCPTAFFLENHEKIFCYKLTQLQQHVEKWLDDDYWRNELKCPAEKYMVPISLYTQCFESSLDFARKYLAWFGVPYQRCRAPHDFLSDDVSLGWSSVWMNRYLDFSKTYELKGHIACPDDVFALGYIASCFHELENEFILKLPDKLKTERELKRIGEQYKEMAY